MNNSRWRPLIGGLSSMAKKKAHSGTANGKITQADAVRQALASGLESSKAGMDFIKRKFGITMKPQAYYSYKSQLLKRNGKGKFVAPSARPQAAPPKKGHDLGDFRLIKSLVDKYGAKHVKEIVELFE